MLIFGKFGHTECFLLLEQDGRVDYTAEDNSPIKLATESATNSHYFIIKRLLNYKEVDYKFEDNKLFKQLLRNGENHYDTLLYDILWKKDDLLLNDIYYLKSLEKVSNGSIYHLIKDNKLDFSNQRFNHKLLKYLVQEEKENAIKLMFDNNLVYMDKNKIETGNSVFFTAFEYADFYTIKQFFYLFKKEGLNFKKNIYIEDHLIKIAKYNQPQILKNCIKYFQLEKSHSFCKKFIKESLQGESIDTFKEYISILNINISNFSYDLIYEILNSEYQFFEYFNYLKGYCFDLTAHHNELLLDCPNENIKIELLKIKEIRESVKNDKFLYKQFEKYIVKDKVEAF